MHKLLLFILFLSFRLSANSQSPDFIWAKGIGSTTEYETGSVVADRSGNIYTYGVFVTPIDFDPGPSNYILTPSGLGSTFIMKMDHNGSFIWAIKFDGAINGPNEKNMVVDSIGNIYINLMFNGQTDFDPGPGQYYLNSGSKMAMVKLTSSGNLIWANGFDGPGIVHGASISMNRNNENSFYIMGNFEGAIDFDPDSANTSILSSPISDERVFVLKMDTSGTFIWAKQLDSGGPHICTVDNAGNFYLGGRFNNISTDFDPGPAVFNLPLAGGLSSKVYMVKLNNMGNFVWANQFAGSGDVYGFSMANDESSNLYICGTFSDTIDFDTGTGNYNLISPVNGDNCFITKLDNAGSFIWAKKIDNARTFAIVVDNKNNIFTSGNFYGYADMDPGPDSSIAYSPPLSLAIFLLKLDSSGNFQFANPITSMYSDAATSLVYDNDGFVYLSGSYSSSLLMFGSIPLTNNNNPYRTDVFIAKLDTLTITTDVVNRLPDNHLNVFPNPSSKVIRFECPTINKPSQITIYDLHGNICLSTISEGVKFAELNIEKYSQGLYFLQLQSEGVSVTRKFSICK